MRTVAIVSMNGLSFRFAQAKKLQQNSTTRSPTIAKISGVDYSVVKELESGGAVSIYNIVLLAKTLNVSPLWLSTGEGHIGQTYNDGQDYPMARLIAECLEVNADAMKEVLDEAKELKRRRIAFSSSARSQSAL